ncbi:hypothetical protein C9374_006262 [Naegleria lovaniensis]|uniref:Striatin N-terminal domain-containing protein n=1 Tax=Naegleria lovaniensis TaxID=51637 RepID=A0AA88KIZ4_NAELO|nr:uncharacterized protein C9374_006262 [Naegleria lovaniensis]KAG2381273.1 hypothetical protein C9374_006262 [Naegleria lovaniensis]
MSGFSSASQPFSNGSSSNNNPFQTPPVSSSLLMEGSSNSGGFYSMNTVNNAVLQNLNFPTTINFLQREFRKFENERELWELERGELSTTIAHLESFRKSQEKIQYDLLRRIKMLEFALRTERSKFSTLVDHIRKTESSDESYKKNLLSFCESLVTTAKPVVSSSSQQNNPSSSPATTANTNLQQNGSSNTTSTPLAKPKSLEIMRNYLKEIESSDLWSLIADIPENTPSNMMNAQYVLSSTDPKSIGLATQELSVASESDHTTATTSSISMTNHTGYSEYESTISSTTDTLPTQNSDSHKSKNLEKSRNEENTAEAEDMKKFITQLRQRGYSDKTIEKTIGEKIPEDMLEEVKPWKDEDSQLSSDGLSLLGKKKPSWKLEDIVVKNDYTSELSTKSDFESGSSFNSQSLSSKPISWKPKYTLKHHLDSVRSIAFHPTENYLISGSEDCTVKVWNVTKLNKSKANEPIQTLRGHTGAVYTVLCGSGQVFSAGQDDTIIVWNIPPLDHNPYTNYGYATPFLHTSLTGHSDAIWSLSLHETSHLLLSASADETVMVWDYESSTSPLLKTFSLSKIGTPTYVSFLPNDNSKFVVSFSNSKLGLFDTEMGRPIWVSDSLGDESKSSQHLIYQFECHGKVPMIITAHEDKKIRYYDSSSGKVINEMVGHKEAVTSVSVDSNGLYFASVGHDSSLRIWDIASKHCIQELPAHRKKYDEAIHEVSYHPTKSLLATCGADSIIKMYC